MAAFHRRRLPAERRPPLARDERIVAWSDSDAGLLVATNLGLWLPASPPGRLGWDEIHKAAWNGAELVVTAARQVAEREGYTVVGDAPPVTFQLRDPGHVPHQVRARVTRSVGYSMHHARPGVRLAARRVPGVDGLRWTVRYDPGVDPDDPDVVAATGRLVEAARE
jgi:hypothetical protein